YTRGKLVATRGEVNGFSFGQHPQIAATFRWCNCQLFPGGVALIDAPLGRSGDRLAGRPVRGDENPIGLKLTPFVGGGLAPFPVIGLKIFRTLPVERGRPLRQNKNGLNEGNILLLVLATVTDRIGKVLHYLAPDSSFAASIIQGFLHRLRRR